MNEREEKLAEVMRRLAGELKVIGEKFREMDAISALAVEMSGLMAIQCNANPDLPPMPEATVVAEAAQGYRDASQRLHTSWIRFIDRMEFVSDQILNGESPSSED